LIPNGTFEKKKKMKEFFSEEQQQRIFHTFLFLQKNPLQKRNLVVLTIIKRF